MANLDISIPASLKTVLDVEVTRTKSVVTAALSQYLGVPFTRCSRSRSPVRWSQASMTGR
jgi:hypothetical protein